MRPACCRTEGFRSVASTASGSSWFGVSVNVANSCGVIISVSGVSISEPRPYSRTSRAAPGTTEAGPLAGTFSKAPAICCTGSLRMKRSAASMPCAMMRSAASMPCAMMP